MAQNKAKQTQVTGLAGLMGMSGSRVVPEPASSVGDIELPTLTVILDEVHGMSMRALRLANEIASSVGVECLGLGNVNGPDPDNGAVPMHDSVWHRAVSCRELLGNVIAKMEAISERIG